MTSLTYPAIFPYGPTTQSYQGYSAFVTETRTYHSQLR